MHSLRKKKNKGNFTVTTNEHSAGLDTFLWTFKKTNYFAKKRGKTNHPRKLEIKKLKTKQAQKMTSQWQNKCSYTGILFGAFHSTLTRRSWSVCASF